MIAFINWKIGLFELFKFKYNNAIVNYYRMKRLIYLSKDVRGKICGIPDKRNNHILNKFPFK